MDDGWYGVDEWWMTNDRRFAGIKTFCKRTQPLEGEKKGLEGYSCQPTMCYTTMSVRGRPKR